MQQIQRVVGTGVPLVLDEIDTDRIIPARFLRCVSFEGLGEHAFEDDRKQDPHHPFDNPAYAGGSILVTGSNFGCGSSREHAPQSLIRWGIRAIVGESFAEIFFGNCTSLGVPAVCAAPADVEKLEAAVKADPQLEITVDLEDCQVRFGNESIPCTIPDSARTALVSGEWDFLAQLLEGEADIRRTAEQLPYMTNFA
jgi:3-isopropylmalate/(R)-2-methylmalate dehydratase small subunit